MLKAFAVEIESWGPNRKLVLVIMDAACSDYQANPLQKEMEKEKENRVGTFHLFLSTVTRNLFVGTCCS